MARLGLKHTANYSCKKIFLYDLLVNLSTSVTDEQTDDNRTISSTIT